MEIVKKNLVSIICGLVAVMALVAVFVWPLDGYYETLKTKAEDRAKVQGKISTLLSKTRVIPVFDPNNPTPANLPAFPSKTLIDRVKTATQGIAGTSDKVVQLAVQLNEYGHELVLPNSLPSPMNQPIALKFRRVLQDALDQLRTTELLAGIPPTLEEFNNRADIIWKGMQKDIIVLPDNTTPNLDQVMARYQDKLNKLPDEMKAEMATKNKMYIDPLNVMRVSASLPADGNSPSRESIWWSQVAFWITKDVAMAIKDVNASSQTVTDSPIKNLLALTIPEDFFPPGVAALASQPAALGTGGRGAAESPSDTGATPPVTGGLPDATLALPDGSTQTPTKRISNNLFDVVQFKMTLDIEADKIPLFLKTLATNRFITVTRMEMNPVDSQLKQILGYVYGPRPVVTLDLDCEALLLRQWTLKWMPLSIRKALGVPDSTPGTGTGTPTRVGRAF
jgi:hypothetical protein